MLDLLLVNPGAKAQTYGPLSELSAIEPPLWCALLAAFIREHGYSVAILDAEAEGLGAEQTAQRVAELAPRLCAIIVLGSNPSVSSTPKMDAVQRVHGELKSMAPQVKTLLGGLHPSALPYTTLQEARCDFVCQGEGFQTLVDLLGRLDRPDRIPGLWHRKTGGMAHCSPAALADVNSLPLAAWDLLPMDKYRCHNWQSLDAPDKRSPYAMVFTSLGCCYNCHFCNINAMYGGRSLVRLRDADKVAAEIDHLATSYGVRNFKFMDEMFALKKSRVAEICDAIVALGHDLNIWAYARADTVDKAMLARMKQAGINWLCFGFESCSDIVRSGVSKKYATERIAEVVQMCRAAGINIIANFLFGLPDDDMKTMRETLDIAKQFNFEYANFYCAAAYPGSKLYEDAVKQGVRLPATWADYSQFSPSFIPLPTKHLKAEEVLQFRDRAFREYFDRPEYLTMIEQKFGSKAREHIQEMLSLTLPRTKVPRSR